MEIKFNTPVGETIARELLVAYLNTGTSEAIVWSPIGRRSTDSSEALDWGEETTQDILGNTYSTMKKPVLTQTFDPWPLNNGDEAQLKIHQLAVVEQNAPALSNQDMMIAHYYTTDKGNTAGSFAERYESCMIKPSGLGGEGGGILGMPIDVTYGGKRTVGTAVRSTDGTVTFTPEGGASPAQYSARSGKGVEV